MAEGHNLQEQQERKQAEVCLRFVRFCLDDAATEFQGLDQVVWPELLKFGVRQTIMGVLFHGVQKLSNADHLPDKFTVAALYSAYLEIEQQNKQVYHDCVVLSENVKRRWGLRSVILKGQGNALMYPDPMMRSPGDIDLWTDADTITVVKKVKSVCPDAKIDYHHIDAALVKTPVEIHFFPSFMGNLFYEYRLRKYFNKERERQMQHVVTLPGGKGQIGVPTDDFNRVFQLSHIMHHFFFEGIGLRQMIDYYYLLRRGFTEEERQETVKVLRYTNMEKFACAVMYVMHDVLGLPHQYLLVEPDEKHGRVLMSEILKAGNFGFYDHRYSFNNHHLASQYLMETWRNLHYAWMYPSEAIWGRPLSRFWHAVYKRYVAYRARKA